MAYTKKIWKDYPDTTTPILASDMNNIENGIEAADTVVNSGWVPLTGTFTYSSADSPTFVMTTSVDLTGIVGLGMRIKLTQATTKYFIVTAITNNSITMYGGTDYTLVNASISNVYYSMLKAPFGFPTNPTKWSIIVSAPISRANATVNTYYASGTTLSAPIGAWEFFWSSVLTISGGSAAQVSGSTSLSTSTSSHSDSTMVSTATGYIYTATAAIVSSISKNKVYTLTNKTTYYIVGVITQTAGTTGLFSSNYISATCAYL